MKAVFLDIQGLDDLQLDELKSQFDEFVTYAMTSPNQVAERIAGADVVIVNKVRIEQEHMEAAVTLKLICVTATGTNNVDLVAAEYLNIRVYNCQAYGVPAVVQHTFALILALHTNLLKYDVAVKAGAWQKASQFCLLDYPINELSGRTIGIVGFGHLGQGVAKIAEAFGMKVLIAQRDISDTRDGRVPLSELLACVDVLSIHCPLTDETTDLIDAAALSLMKPTAFLVNVARGGVVNEQALADALRQGVIAGAATDVLTVEPPTDDNPLLASGVPNLIVTPHSAWGSKEARQRIVNQTVENIRAFSTNSAQRRII